MIQNILGTTHLISRQIILRNFQNIVELKNTGKSCTFLCRSFLFNNSTIKKLFYLSVKLNNKYNFKAYHFNAYVFNAYL